MDEQVALDLAKDPETQAESLAELALHESFWVRHAVARHRNTSPEVLTLLSQDDASVVREAVAGNNRTPREVWEGTLAYDVDWSVRLATVPKVQGPGLTSLLEDPNEHVRRSAQARKQRVDAFHKLVGLEETLGEEAFKQLLESIVDSPASSSVELWVIYHVFSRSFAVELSLAWNPNTPVSVLREIASNTLSRSNLSGLPQQVAFQLAANPRTPLDVREALSQHPDTQKVLSCASPGTKPYQSAHRGSREPHGEFAVLAAAGNECMDKEFLSKLERITRPHPEPWSTSAPYLSPEQKRQNLRIRLALAANIGSPAEVLASLATDKSEWVRERVASNPTAPGDVIKALHDDSAKKVAAAARENLERPAPASRKLTTLRRASAPQRETASGQDLS